MVDVNDYIRKKYNLDAYGDDKRNELVQQNADAASPLLAGLAAFGAGIAGKDVGQAFKQATDYQQAPTQQALQAFDKNRANAIDAFKFDQDVNKAAQENTDYKRNHEKIVRESDVNSAESALARDLAAKMIPGRSFEGMNAQQINGLLPSLTKIYDIQQQSLNRAAQLQASKENKEASIANTQAYREAAQATRDQTRSDKLALEAVRAGEKADALRTPYGQANTPDDAKQLKEAHEAKSNFDSQLSELIELRQKFGGELFNREAVARGKQLSKNLLLEYKNMAKLGVLSKSDEDIINAIIPTDPLEFNLSTATGQDPTLYRLQKFKEDSDKDFATRVATRTKQGNAAPIMTASGQTAPRTVRVVDPAGIVRMVPEDQVDAALKAGGRLADKSLAGGM